MAVAENAWFWFSNYPKALWEVAGKCLGEAGDLLLSRQTRNKHPPVFPIGFLNSFIFNVYSPDAAARPHCPGYSLLR